VGITGSLEGQAPTIVKKIPPAVRPAATTIITGGVSILLSVAESNLDPLDELKEREACEA
jgi:hypothetical protein